MATLLGEWWLLSMVLIGDGIRCVVVAAFGSNGSTGNSISLVLVAVSGSNSSAGDGIR